MRSFRSDPYLWIHLAGLAAVPLWLELCLVGIAVGNPILPLPLELGAIALVGTVPIFVMQWQRPFYIFSLLLVAVKPSALTVEQRQLLPLFRDALTKAFTALTATLLVMVLWQLYRLAPFAINVARLLPRWHLLGLLIAAIAFLFTNLFFQVPVSVIRVLLARDEAIAQRDPYPVDQISQDFTILGLRVNQILPPLKLATTAADTPSSTSAPTSTTTPSPSEASSSLEPTAEPIAEPTAEPAVEPEATDTSSETSPSPQESDWREADDAIAETATLSPDHDEAE